MAENKMKNKKKILLSWNLIFYTLLIVAVYTFALGFHNIDLAYNFKGVHSIDCNLLNCVSIDDRYMYGVAFLEISFFMVVVTCVTLKLIEENRL